MCLPLEPHLGADNMHPPAWGLPGPFSRALGPPLHAWQAPAKPQRRSKAACLPQYKASRTELGEARAGLRPFPSAKPAVFRAEIKSARRQRVHLTMASQPLCSITQPFRYRGTALSLCRTVLCATLAVLVWFSTFISIQKTLCQAHTSGSLTHRVISVREAVSFPAKAIRLRQHSKSHQTFKGLSNPPTPPGEGSTVGSCLLPSTVKALDTSIS